MHFQIRPRPAATPLISVILLDWGVRESFHSLDYLNTQTWPRDRVELIWVEFYRRRPEAVREAVEDPSSRAPIDKWIVLEYDDEVYYHKHHQYNAGIIAAEGEICIICDSDAVFAPTFLHSVALAFRASRRQVVHVDEVRSNHRGFYPFNAPSINRILDSDGLVNWTGGTTTGLVDHRDPLHELNYGACMAALRRDLIEIGGADEHLDYLGYICGPHEMTFRLVNQGHREVWLQHEWIYHTWHPGQAGSRNFGGPHDGRGFSTRTLDLKVNGRTAPWVESPAIARLAREPGADPRELLELLAASGRPEWRQPAEHLDAVDPVELVEEDVAGFNIVQHQDLFVAIRQGDGAFVMERLLARRYREAYVGRTLEEVKAGIAKGRRSPFHLSRVALPGSPAPGGRVDLPDTTPGDAAGSPWAWPAGGAGSVASSGPGAEAPARLRVRSRLAGDYGWALYQDGRTRDALTRFEEAVACDPDSRAARRGRGLARVALGQAALGLEDFSHVLGALPRGGAPERAEDLADRAWANYHLGRWPAAVADFTEALVQDAERRPDLARNIYRGRSWAHAHAGRRREALDDFLALERLAGRRIPRSPVATRVAFWTSQLRGRAARMRRRGRALFAAG
jgi:tetratricopeptide (TPR) repeat protein